MLKSGLNGVLMAIEPAELNDSHKLEMIRTFLVLASNNRVFKVAFLFAPTNQTQLSKSNVSSFMKRKGLLDYPSVYKYSDNNVLFFSDKVELVSTGKPDFIYVKLDISGKLATSEQKTAGLIDYPSIPIVSNYYHVVHVFSGLIANYSDKSQWLVSRKNGIAFHGNLEHCIKLSPDVIVISSWNDFSQGSAIENNMFDDIKLQEILKAFLQKYR